MNPDEETVQTIQGRLNVLTKGIVSEENSVQYYETLLEKTPQDNEESIGAWRMYGELRQEEVKHVEKFKSLIQHWEGKLREIQK